MRESHIRLRFPGQLGGTRAPGLGVHGRSLKPEEIVMKNIVMKDRVLQGSASKPIGAIGIAVLSLIVGCAAASHAQQAEGRQQVQRIDDQNLDNSRVGLISNSRYRARFGERNTFHLGPAAYGQGSRFEHGGYSFGFVDEWPTNWLAKEDVFVTRKEGAYYLCNRRYPGVIIPITIAANREVSMRLPRTKGSKTSRAKVGAFGTASAG